MIKAAIVVCGKIADAHAWAISQISDAEIVGACDNEELMAKQLCSESLVTFSKDEDKHMVCSKASTRLSP